MSVLARTNWLAQQRVDLNGVLASDSYNAFDLRTIISAFSGTNPYVLSGLEISSKTGLAISVSVKNSLVFNASDGNGAFYTGLSTDTDVVLNLPAEQQNLFVQAVFQNVSQAPLTSAFWDPLALNTDNAAGSEFSASANSQIVMVMSITINSVGFDETAIPIARLSTDGANVYGIIDCRPLLFRLGTGGTTPDPSHRFPWGTQRKEPVDSGSQVGNDADSPFASSDPSGIINDKGLKTFKDWMDAVMTRLIEISGASLWYGADTSPGAPTYGYVTGLDLQRVYLDSEAGHSINASETVAIEWSR